MSDFGVAPTFVDFKSPSLNNTIVGHNLDTIWTIFELVDTI